MMNGAAHPDDLLPWYANRTLAAAEREAVEAHLGGCARCRGEIALLEALREQVRQSTDASAPDRLGLQRLLRDVRRAPVHRERNWLRPALAASVAAIAVQAVLIGWLLTREPGIEPLGGAHEAGVVLQIRFDAAASESRIRSVLQDSHAAIVDGPGALGVYRVRLRDVHAGEREAVAKALEKLRAVPGVVMQAEAE
jgi:anti-sigma factor RsiW